MSTVLKGLLRRQRSSESEFFKKYTLSTTTLGKGAYAEVRLGCNLKTDENVAVKIINKAGQKESDLKKLHKEVKILQSLKHRNVVKVLDYYDTSDTFYIVMEYINGGELFNKIVDEEIVFSEERSREIIRTIAEALKYCKDNGVIHRDIKPENILLTEDGDIKVADFNLSKQIDKEAINFSILETMCGTPNYVAPEVISGSPYDYKCDIWSLGVISFLLLSGGYLPFYVNPKKEGREALLKKVREGRWKFSPENAWANVSPTAKNFLTKVLKKEPEARYGYEQLLSHAWFKAAADDMNKRIDIGRMMKFNEKRRLLAAAKAKVAVDMFAEFMLDDADESFQMEPNVPGSVRNLFDESMNLSC